MRTMYLNRDLRNAGEALVYSKVIGKTIKKYIVGQDIIKTVKIFDPLDKKTKKEKVFLRLRQIDNNSTYIFDIINIGLERL